jgi:hypothetical protein
MSALPWRIGFRSPGNLCEGIPTEALEAGCVRRFHEAVDELLAAVAKLDNYSGNGATLVVQRRAEQVTLAFDAYQLDLDHGRLHDCATCLAGNEAEMPISETTVETGPSTPVPRGVQAELF